MLYKQENTSEKSNLSNKNYRLIVVIKNSIVCTNHLISFQKISFGGSRNGYMIGPNQNLPHIIN